MSDGHAVELLRFEAPYDWPALIGFLTARATPGVEQVEPNRYRRTIAAGGRGGVIEVGYEAGRAWLELRVSSGTPVATETIVTRVRRLFDLDADPQKPQAILTGDTLFVGDVGRPDLRASL